MAEQLFIPPATLIALGQNYPPGTRHAAMFEIAMPLIGNGHNDQAVFQILRSKFSDEDKSDEEIASVINWCKEKGPTPSVPTEGKVYQLKPVKKEKPKITTESARQLVDEILGEDKLTPDQISKRSPLEIPELSQQGQALFSSLYSDSDCVNIVCDYTISEKGKANPKGGGKTLLRDEWISYINEKGVPQSKAGAWIRPNPCAKIGTGKGESVQDSDITQFRFMLVESDILSIEQQLGLYAIWKLPVACVVMSGGDSAHCWLRLDSPDAETYRATVKKILDVLAPLGFDQSNKNPSRLSRLAGAKRVIGAFGEGLQRLLYLNPSVEPKIDLDALQKQLRPKAPQFPLRQQVLDSVSRYEHTFENRGKTGVPTGIPSFDRKTGGLKKGNFVIIAAETNVGKTTLALNMMNHAMSHGIRTALFSFEMDSGEVIDQLFSMNYNIDRNVFNTGDFTERDLMTLTGKVGEMSKKPLHLFDDPGLGLEQMEEECLKIQDLGLIVVDYIQLVNVIGFRDNREQQVASISKFLKRLAKKCGVPVIALSQLNDEGRMRESRAIAHDANIVIILEEGDGGLVAKVTKGRGIPKGDYLLNFIAQYCKINEQSRIREEDIPR